METIERKEIKGDVPKEAQYAKQNPSGLFIEKFYKINEHGIPCYWGERGAWFASFSFTKEQLLNHPYFIKII